MTTRQLNRSPFVARALPTFAATALAVLVAAGCDKKKNEPAPQAAGNGGAGAAAQPTNATAPPPPPADGGGATSVLGSTKDISANPAVLHDASVPPQQFELYGIKLGDALAAIPPGDITRGPDDSGLVDFRGKSNVFRIDNGKVAGLYLNDRAALSKLGIRSDADVVKQFGQPDAPVEASPTDPQASYTFKSRMLTVVYSPRDKQVIAVNVDAQ